MYIRSFPKPFYHLGICFQNSFITTAAVFQTGLANQKVTKARKAAKKFLKICETLNLSERFLLNCVKKLSFLYLISWGPLKNVKARCRLYSGLGLSIYVKNGIKSRLAVPLRRSFRISEYMAQGYLDL